MNIVKKKKTKTGIEEYHNHLKEELYKQLELVPVNFEGEGLEEIIMDHEDVIKKYSFLKEIIKEFFPMIYEPNIEIQKSILESALAMEYDKEKEKFLSQYLEIVEIGDLRYEEIEEPDEIHILKINDDGKDKIETIPRKLKSQRKVPCRTIIVKDLDTGERKEIKMYRNFTVQPL